MHTWPKANTAPFCRTQDEFGFFSNFHRSAVQVGGKYWLTTEHLYQAAKFTDPTVIETIRCAATPKIAKEIAWNNSASFCGDWDDVKLLVMTEIIGLKISNWFGVSLSLFSDVGDRDIVEVSYKDAFWGAKPVNDTYVGTNALGQIWTTYKTKWERGESLTAPASGRLPTNPLAGKFFVEA